MWDAKMVGLRVKYGEDEMERGGGKVKLVGVVARTEDKLEMGRDKWKRRKVEKKRTQRLKEL